MIKKTKSKHKKVAAIMNNKLTVFNVLREEIHAPANDFGDLIHYIVLKNKNFAGEVYLNINSVLFGDEK